jgi:predicted Zn-dependent protease
MRKTLLLLFASLPCLALATNELPDLGDSSQEVMSPQQERGVGQQSMYEIRADKSYLDDAEVADYLTQLGYKLIANSDAPSQEFEFFAINDPAINAFALPGGFVGVNTGLILTAQSESELASVLSHEIAHVTQHHIARLMAGQRYDSIASMAALAAAILASRSNPQAAQAAIVGVTANNLQRQLNFTRSFEQEADRIGLEMLEKSDFDTHAMPAFFERMQKGTRLLEGNAPSYLRTHPLTSERIADIGNRVQQMPFKLVADSLSFHLVRAKLLATEKSPQDAARYFRDALGPERFGNPTAQRYGLVLALQRQHRYAEALKEFAPLDAQSADNPMLTRLAGQLRQANHQDKGILDFYRNAIQTFPQHRTLTYDYAALLLDKQRYDNALGLLEERIKSYPDDANLYDLQARAYAAKDKPQLAHHALAYASLSRGQLMEAIQQLEYAKRSGNDFYQLSTLDSELKQLREIAAAHLKKK